MNTTKSNQPLALGSTEGLGPLLEAVRPVAYLYHDASTPEDAHPWLHSTMLVLAADRRPNLRNETPLLTLAQAEAMVVAERERICAAIKAEDDYMVDRDYMLDSDDCIAVARGQWKRPE